MLLRLPLVLVHLFYRHLYYLKKENKDVLNWLIALVCSQHVLEMLANLILKNVSLNKIIRCLFSDSSSRDAMVLHAGQFIADQPTMRDLRGRRQWKEKGCWIYHTFRKENRKVYTWENEETRNHWCLIKFFLKIRVINKLSFLKEIFKKGCAATFVNL